MISLRAFLAEGNKLLTSVQIFPSYVYLLFEVFLLAVPRGSLSSPRLWAWCWREHATLGSHPAQSSCSPQTGFPFHAAITLPLFCGHRGAADVISRCLPSPGVLHTPVTDRVTHLSPRAVLCQGHRSCGAGECHQRGPPPGGLCQPLTQDMGFAGLPTRHWLSSNGVSCTGQQA